MIGRTTSALSEAFVFTHRAAKAAISNLVSVTERSRISPAERTEHAAADRDLDAGGRDSVKVISGGNPLPKRELTRYLIER